MTSVWVLHPLPTRRVNTMKVIYEDEEYTTTYEHAINVLGRGIILCNNICELDQSVYDNFEREIYNEETGDYIDIYQWYLTPWSRFDVEYAKETFPDLIITYSEKLDLYVLCVDHFGTCWDYVLTTTTIDTHKREIGQC